MALGMTLAMIVTVASIRETVRVWVETTLRSDLWIKADAGGRTGIVGDLPQDVLPFLQSIEGVGAVDPFRAREASDERGRPFTLASGDFRVAARSGGLPLLDGRDPRRGGARGPRARGGPGLRALRPALRRREGRPRCALPTPAGPREFRVAGVYRDYSNDRGTVVMDRELYLALYADPRITSLAVTGPARRRTSRPCAAGSSPRPPGATLFPSRRTGSCGARSSRSSTGPSR